MLQFHRRRAAPIRVSVGLIMGLASALTAAEPSFVPPDETAELSPVVSTESLDPFVGRAPATDCASYADIEFDVSSAGILPPVVCPGVIGESDGHPDFDPTLDESCASIIRAQSPSIELLPLSTGDAAIEQTSLLRALTGTKGRLRADYLTDFDETDRVGIHALTQVWNGVGVDTDVNYWQRPLAGLGREPLWTGDFNLIYNFPPHPRFNFRSGAGAAWTVDDGKFRTGYNVSHGLDVYLLWRAMVTGELDWGQIESDMLFRYRLAFGLTFDSCEVFTGYESYELGNERLDGWVNGIAFWY